MTKESAPGGLLRSTLTLFITVMFMAGCGSTSQSERIISVATMPELPPNTKAKSIPPETTSEAEQNPVAEVDEKNSIFFSLGSSAISQNERAKLNRAAQHLKGDSGLCVFLIGHANDNGSPSFNLAVSDARVESVSKVLKKLGVKAHQIKKKVIGGKKPPSFCQSVACLKKMRRVELIISKVGLHKAL